MKAKNSVKDFLMFALPGMFCFFAVLVVPFVYGVYLTFTDWNGVSRVKNLVGFRNYLGVVQDKEFWTSLLLTFRYVILVVILVNVIAFAVAWLLTRGFKGQNFFRVGFFTPNLIGGIVLGYIWQFVFSRVFVNIGESTGFQMFEASWLSTPGKAFAALVLVSVWQLSGYMILIYVAGFMGLNEDVMEAASIDGATGWIKLKSIIMPLMMSSITICLFLTLSRAFMVYDVNLSLTSGGPYGTTQMAAMHVYEKAFTQMDFLNAFKNSIIVTVCSTVLVTLFAAMLAYYIVRRNNKVSKLTFALMVASMIIPFQAIMIPLVNIYGATLNILNHRITLIFMHTGFSMAMSVFMFHGFIKGNVPIALEEAACIDGCSHARTFFQVVLPLLRPIISTLVILNSMAFWNDFLLPSLVLTDKKLLTLPLSTYSFYGTYSADYGTIMAGLLLCVIPIMILYIALQKQIIGGVVAGAVK